MQASSPLALRLSRFQAWLHHQVMVKKSLSERHVLILILFFPVTKAGRGGSDAMVFFNRRQVSSVGRI